MTRKARKIKDPQEIYNWVLSEGGKVSTHEYWEMVDGRTSLPPFLEEKEEYEDGRWRYFFVINTEAVKKAVVYPQYSHPKMPKFTPADLIRLKELEVQLEAVRLERDRVDERLQHREYDLREKQMNHSAAKEWVQIGVGVVGLVAEIALPVVGSALLNGSNRRY